MHLKVCPNMVPHSREWLRQSRIINAETLTDLGMAHVAQAHSRLHF
jgi:hypothetical protein